MTRRPSVLAVTSELPWPLASGGHLRTYHLLASLARRCDVRLVVPSTADEAEARAALGRSGIVVCAVPIGRAPRARGRLAHRLGGGPPRSLRACTGATGGAPSCARCATKPR